MASRVEVKTTLNLNKKHDALIHAVLEQQLGGNCSSVVKGALADWALSWIKRHGPVAPTDPASVMTRQRRAATHTGGSAELPVPATTAVPTSAMEEQSPPPPVVTATPQVLTSVQTQTSTPVPVLPVAPPVAVLPETVAQPMAPPVSTTLPTTPTAIIEPVQVVQNPSALAYLEDDPLDFVLPYCRQSLRPTTEGHGHHPVTGAISSGNSSAGRPGRIIGDI
jgi:hypothetical protein